MLNKMTFAQRDEILAHAESLGVNARGLAYIATALSNPSRDASSGGLKSFGVNYASPVAAEAIQADSVTVELKFLLRAQICGETLLCIDQPGCIGVVGRSPKGRNTRYVYSPDYLVISKTRIYGVECKTEASLATLVETRPFDYRYEDGRYQFVPAQHYLRGLNISFEVFSDAEVSQIALANLMLVCPLQTLEPLTDQAQAVIGRARELLDARPRSLSALIRRLGPGSEMHLLVALANRELFGTLGSISLNNLERFQFFSCEQAAKRADSRELERIALDAVEHNERWAGSAARLSTADLRGARRRLKRITQIERGEIPPNGNDRHVIATYKQKISEGAEPELAAATSFSSSGNRGCRIGDQLEVFKDAFDRHIATPSPLPIVQAYGMAADELRSRGITPASYERFRQFVKSRDPKATALKQSGSRGYQSKFPITSIDQQRPEALAAGEVVHVDSSPEDCRVFAELDGVLALERPSIAVAVCERTSMLLGFAVAFGSASRFLLALLLRDIVRRWGFFPQWIVNDGGPEHRSNMWKNGLAWNRCSVIRRPGAAARAGQCVESAINAINYGLPRKLSGSTRNDEARRSAANSTKSRATAIHHFAAVHKLLQEDFREYLESTPKSFAEKSPREWFLEERSRRPVGFAADITQPMTLIETAVPVAVRQFELDPTRGLKVGLRNYSSMALIDGARSHRRFEEVRIDPEDPSLIYVRFESGWVTADSQDALELRQLPEIDRLVEGMHARTRADSNKELRADAQVKLNKKIGELEARAKSIGKKESQSPSESASVHARTSDIFARLSSGTTKRFKTGD